MLAAAVAVPSAVALGAPASAAPSVVRAADVPAAPSITSIVGGLAPGQLLVSYTAPLADGGSPVTGYEVSVDAGVTWWPCVGTAGTCTLTNLTNGTPYSVSLRAVNAAGPGPASAPVAATPSIPDPAKPAVLPKPRSWVGATFRSAINGLGVTGATTKLGVGTLPAITFSKAIPDKAVAEKHLTVTALGPDGTTKVVRGAWGWISDRTAVFRPAKYWPGRSTITVTSTLDKAVLGKSGKKYVIGSPKLATSWSFSTARKLVARVDGKTDRMKVYIDGKKVGSGRAERTQPMGFSADEACDVGRDTGSPASPDYGPTDNAFTGTIDWVQIDVGDDGHDHLITPEDRFNIAMAKQ